MAVPCGDEEIMLLQFLQGQNGMPSIFKKYFDQERLSEG
jgi:hypothetical protein